MSAQKNTLVFNLPCTSMLDWRFFAAQATHYDFTRNTSIFLPGFQVLDLWVGNFVKSNKGMAEGSSPQPFRFMGSLSLPGVMGAVALLSLALHRLLGMRFGVRMVTRAVGSSLRLCRLVVFCQPDKGIHAFSLKFKRPSSVPSLHTLKPAFN